MTTSGICMVLENNLATTEIRTNNSKNNPINNSLFYLDVWVATPIWPSFWKHPDYLAIRILVKLFPFERAIPPHIWVKNSCALPSRFPTKIATKATVAILENNLASSARSNYNSKNNPINNSLFYLDVWVATPKSTAFEKHPEKSVI